MKKSKIQDNELQLVCEALYTINKEAKIIRDKRNQIKNFLFNYKPNRNIIVEYNLSLGLFNQYISLPKELKWKGEYILYSEYHIEEVENIIKNLLMKNINSSNQQLLDIYNILSGAYVSISALHEYLKISHYDIADIYDLKNNVLSIIIKNLKIKPIGYHQFPNLDIRPCYQILQFNFHGKEIIRNVKKLEIIKLNHEISSENLLKNMSFEDAINILNNFLDNHS